VKSFVQADRFDTGHNSNKSVFFLCGDFLMSEFYVPGNNPEERTQLSEHADSLKSSLTNFLVDYIPFYCWMNIPPELTPHFVTK